MPSDPSDPALAPITVGFFLCQGGAPSMIGGRNGIMARLVPPTIISNHIAFPRPPINDFSYFINYAICVAMRFGSS